MRPWSALSSAEWIGRRVWGLGVWICWLIGPYRVLIVHTVHTLACLVHRPSSCHFQTVWSFDLGRTNLLNLNPSSPLLFFFLLEISNFQHPPRAISIFLPPNKIRADKINKKARFKYILLYCTRKIVSTPVSTLSLSRVESVSQSALHYYLQSALSSQRLRLIIVGLIVSIKYCNTVYLGIILCSKWNTHRQQFPFSFGWCKPTLW